MIFSDTHKFVFLHNPKCGGMTIRKSLEPFDTTGLLFWGRARFDRNSTSKEHMPLGLFRQLFPEHFARMAEYFSFVFVRDPYARAVSAFNQAHDRRDVAALAQSGDPERIAEYRRLLNDFYAALSEPDVQGFGRIGRGVGHSVPNRHLVRQCDMVYLDSKCHADLVLRIEAWETEIDRLAVLRPDLAATIGGQRQRNTKALPAAKQTYLEPRGISRINELYHDDFRLFGYPMTEL